jgi:hypothetical protein
MIKRLLGLNDGAVLTGHHKQRSHSRFDQTPINSDVEAGFIDSNLASFCSGDT